MSEDFIRIMHALFLPAGESRYESPWRPAADVYRGRNGWLVKFELAGVRPEDLELTVMGNRLTLRGIRRDNTALEGCRYYQMEIAYSPFERSLTLPCDLERVNVTSEYRDGMLLVRIPEGGSS
ncbi:MAG TPA: Hsp20/alpha crystallin family protein [Gemmataceae bacterium]|nr:Hsp20/alpha crystallin family protein [Gemmataceae bacterium]